MTKTNYRQNRKFFIFSLKRNLEGIIFSVIIFLIMMLIISNPAFFSNSTISGIKLFFYSVLPGLFPFMFLTKLLTELGTIFKITKRFENVSHKTFGTSGVSLYCFFMSILSGYPIGAKIISDLYQKKLINDEDAKRMSIFCTTSGPIFVIGAVGVGMLSSFKLGVIIYISHILSSVICGLIYNLIFKNKDYSSTKIIISNNNKNSNIFASCLNDTISSLFMVGGYITIFYLATETLDVLGIIEILSKFFSKLFNLPINEVSGFIYGIVEVTHGIKNLSTLAPPNIPIICSLISFSGISILMQSLTFLKTAKIKARDFIFVKLVQMILSFIICYIFLILILR